MTEPDCAAWRFISVADDDVLTGKTAELIAANDMNWLKLCGQPPSFNIGGENGSQKAQHQGPEIKP